MIFQPKDKQKALDYIEKLLKLNHTFEIVTKYKKRSLPQNRYLHLILAKFSIEFGYDLQYTKQEIFKKDVNFDIFYIRKYNTKKDYEFCYYRSTSDLDSKEMTEAIQRFRIYSSKEGLYLPEANEIDYLIDIENEIERYKEWL